MKHAWNYAWVVSDCDSLCSNVIFASKVHVGVQAKDKGLVLTIDDDGPGISDSERDNLVRRGQRADTSIPGQGIGLAVVNDIVENYAGELELSESQLGGLQVSLRFDT